ncbi:hypothetical protein [Streptomyces sp. NBC_01462]|uniref:hypothetical protein n=1 Tax=Streptomyces sp. NBC_01462 TaxID=2903876 RepID=UPI002E3631F3|nr:hypothetical protein [Streptomyces sp. NBC_01462]
MTCRVGRDSTPGARAVCLPEKPTRSVPRTVAAVDGDAVAAVAVDDDAAAGRDAA